MTMGIRVTSSWDRAPGPQLFLTEPERAARQRPEASTEIAGLLTASFERGGGREGEKGRARERERKKKTCEGLQRKVALRRIVSSMWSETKATASRRARVAAREAAA